MKKTMAILSAVCILFLAAMPCFAVSEGTVYYVDSVSGNDSNSGTSPEQAIRSLAEVSKKEYAPGDKILFHCGQKFEGTLVAKGSGTEENPITVSSYGEGEKPCFTNGVWYLFHIDASDYWTVDNIDFTNASGGALIIDAMQDDVVGITVTHCRFHDIGLFNDSVFFAAISVDNDREKNTVQDLHINQVEISNTCWGIHVNGSNAENENSHFVSPEESYNSNLLFENITIDNASCGGIVLGSVRNSVVRNCRVTDCATAQDSAYAPLWLRHSDNVLVEYCEIAGSANATDGMAIDFDGWTTNCTYDHIYSHNNYRFIKNCVFDAKTRNRGNRVTNCISVNDNQGINMGAIMLFSKHAPSFSYMSDFCFQNNTIVNGSPIIWCFTPFAQNNGNVFAGSFLNTLLHRVFNVFAVSKNNRYVSEMPENLQSDIAQITSHIDR